MGRELKIEDLKRYSKEFKKNKANKIAANAVQRNGVGNAAFDSEAARKMVPIYNVEVKDEPSVTNQKSSGRCWMFAGFNHIRKIVAKNLKVKDIELSENYLMFYDKIEKCNLELDLALKTKDEDELSRQLESIHFAGGQSDGGYWSFFVNLVNKYGIVPIQAQPETVPSSSSSEMDDVLMTLMAKAVSDIRRANKAGAKEEELEAIRDKALNQVYKVLAICLGEPVQQFEFFYTEDAKDDEKKDSKKSKKEEEPKVKSIKTTPLEFKEKYLGSSLDDQIIIVNYPVDGYDFYQRYRGKNTNNVVGTPGEIIINVPIEELKECAIKGLKEGLPMWFACDVVTASYRKEGYLSREVYDLDTLFGYNHLFDKGDRIRYFASQCNHAMTLTGVNLDKKGNPERWKVLNSWGVDNGIQGHFCMSDKWFDEFVYELVIDKKFLSSKAKEALDKPIKEMEPWEPLGF